jgi:hypothetical protein
MKKKLLLTLICFFSIEGFAFDLSCKCPKDECKELRVKSESSENSGTYMKVSFEDGARTLEGFAKIYKNNSINKTVYTVGSFNLVKQGDVYSVADKRRQCL